MKRLCLVKIGGSTITDISRPNTPRIDVIERLAKELKSASKEREIILGHGSGSFGHVPAAKYRTNEGIINKNSLRGASITQHTAAQLHRIVVDVMCNNLINAVSFPPSAGAITKNSRIVNWHIRPIITALKHGFMPVTYGDVTIDTERGVAIVSTEEALRYLAYKLKPYKVVIGSDVDGVYTSNPKLDRDARLIEKIDESNIKSALASATGSTKVDVTGGMHTKLQYLYDIAKKTGATCQIVNINVPGRLYKALTDKEVISTKISVK